MPVSKVHLEKDLVEWSSLNTGEVRTSAAFSTRRHSLPEHVSVPLTPALTFNKEQLPVTSERVDTITPLT